MRVLVVEDERDLNRILTKTLSKAGYSVDGCLNGEEMADHLLGAEYSPADALATVGLRGPVDWTVVNGRVVVREGRLVSVDEERVAEEARACCRAYLS